MSDSQNIPVFMRSALDGEPHFLGRVPVDQLDALVESARKHQCYDGENDPTDEVMTQFICYEDAETHQWFNGFELIIG